MKRLKFSCRILGCLLLFMILGIIGIPSLFVSEYKDPQKEVFYDQSPEICLQLSNGSIIKIRLEDYLVGVVAAEMPASFHPEALKAQVIAARTYALRRVYQQKPSDKHPQAHLCCDPAHCQAWISYEEMREKWGVWHYANYCRKIADAVKETRGEVLTYQEELIDPVYHANCGGKGTEKAVDVWGHDIPYLQSVPCENHLEKDRQAAVITLALDDFFQKIGVSEQAQTVSTGSRLLEVLEHTARGRVKKLQVGNKLLDATDLRSKLSLPSTDFTYKVSEGRLIFTVYGKGHAVGMCQRGAQGMALSGKKYTEILFHYYQGTNIKRLVY